MPTLRKRPKPSPTPESNASKVKTIRKNAKTPRSKPKQRKTTGRVTPGTKTKQLSKSAVVAEETEEFRNAEDFQESDVDSFLDSDDDPEFKIESSSSSSSESESLREEFEIQQQPLLEKRPKKPQQMPRKRTSTQLKSRPCYGIDNSYLASNGLREENFSLENLMVNLSETDSSDEDENAGFRCRGAVSNDITSSEGTLKKSLVRNEITADVGSDGIVLGSLPNNIKTSDIKENNSKDSGKLLKVLSNHSEDLEGDRLPDFHVVKSDRVLRSRVGSRNGEGTKGKRQDVTKAGTGAKQLLERNRRPEKSLGEVNREVDISVKDLSSGSQQQTKRKLRSMVRGKAAQEQESPLQNEQANMLSPSSSESKLKQLLGKGDVNGVTETCDTDNSQKHAFNLSLCKVVLKKLDTISEESSLSETTSPIKQTDGVLLNGDMKIYEDPSLLKTPPSKIAAKKKLRSRVKDVHTVDGDTSDSGSEWEEVSDAEASPTLEDYSPVIPKEGVEVSLELPKKLKRKLRKEACLRTNIRRAINRMRKETWVFMRKVHLLCLLAHGFQINDILRDETMLCLTMSLLPVDFNKFLNRKLHLMATLQQLVNLYCNLYSFKHEHYNYGNDLKSTLIKVLKEKSADSVRDFIFAFILILRCLRLEVRLCVSLYPASAKEENLLKPSKSEKVTFNCDELKFPYIDATKTTTEDDDDDKKAAVSSSKGSKLVLEQPSTSKAQKRKLPISEKCKPKSCKGSGKSSFPQANDDSTSFSDDSDFEDKKKARSKKQPAKRRSSIQNGRKSLVKQEKIVEHFVEVYCPGPKKWVCINLLDGTLDDENVMETVLRDPVLYVLSFDNQNCVKDLTKKYASAWLTTVRKFRLDEVWWEESLRPFLPPVSVRERAENKMMEDKVMSKPIPKTISEFKDHPLYVLQRHLLKFEALYPPNPPPLGFIRGEAVYARECVQNLRSRDRWIRQGRQVKEGEEYYKLVTHLIWDKVKRAIVKVPLELFGHWQTEEYKPPVARDGLVPRNEYGNVDLFHCNMLPTGTVHLKAPGLHRVARKMNIDCAPAVVRFEVVKMAMRPVFEGWVVCEEFKDKLLAACIEETKALLHKKMQKYEQRVIMNWRKLIRGLFIREKIKAKYFSQ